MSTTHESALIPDATRSRLLVVAGDVPALPSWTANDDEEGDVRVATARARYGISAPFLRIVQFAGEHDAEEFWNLVEFDAVAADWEAPAGLTWVEYGGVERTLVPAPLADALPRWLDDQATGEIPARRAAWARSGWFGANARWLEDELRRLGRPPTGAVEQLGSWPISSLLAANTDAGRVILKSVPELFAHEPALTQALAREHPGQVPEVLGAYPERRQLLMAAFGGAQLGNEDATSWGEGLVGIAAIQQAWVGRREDVAGMGLEDRSLAALGRDLESIIADEQASPALAPADRDRLIGNLPFYEELIGRLQAGPVPETLVHGDIHPWNVQRDDSRLVIFDWSDACWGHP